MSNLKRYLLIISFFDTDTTGSTGGLLFDDKPIVCGGKSRRSKVYYNNTELTLIEEEYFMDTCYGLTTNGWVNVVKMQSPRYLASSIVINDKV